MTKSKKILLLLGSIAVIILAVWVLGRLLQPKYASGVLEGGMIEEYYAEENPHDVIFIGDCEVYENFSPVEMWKTCGITSYIRGSAQQLIWQSYTLLEEMFAAETPKVVVYNVQAMKYGEPQSEAYNRMCLDGMRFSKYKIEAVFSSMTDGEDAISYFIPLLRYHARWSELSDEDFTYLFSHKTVTVAGYLMRSDCKPLTRLPSADFLDDYTISSKCWEYLDKIRTLCEEHGTQLILIKSSSIWPEWYDEWDEQITDYAAQYDLPYINFLTLEDEIGIDWSTDTYDGGLHLNIYGAEKVSRYFAKILHTEYDVPDRRNDAEISADWDQKADNYRKLYEAQQQELAEYGYLKSWTLGDDE